MSMSDSPSNSSDTLFPLIIADYFPLFTDSSLGDSWESASEFSLRNFDGTFLPLEFQTTVKARWNERSLNFRFQARYVELTQTPPHTVPNSMGKTMKLWDIADVCEIFIGPEARQTRHYFEFQLAPDHHWLDLAINWEGDSIQTDFNWTAGASFHSYIDSLNMIWYAFITLPIEAFPVSWKAGDEWDINCFRISQNPSFFMSWSPVYRIFFHQPERFGKIRFAK